MICVLQSPVRHSMSDVFKRSTLTRHDTTQLRMTAILNETRVSWFESVHRSVVIANILTNWGTFTGQCCCTLALIPKMNYLEKSALLIQDRGSRSGKMITRYHCIKNMSLCVHWGTFERLFELYRTIEGCSSLLHCGFALTRALCGKVSVSYDYSHKPHFDRIFTVFFFFFFKSWFKNTHLSTARLSNEGHMKVLLFRLFRIK